MFECEGKQETPLSSFDGQMAWKDALSLKAVDGEEGERGREEDPVCGERTKKKEPENAKRRRRLGTGICPGMLDGSTHPVCYYCTSTLLLNSSCISKIEDFFVLSELPGVMPVSQSFS